MILAATMPQVATDVHIKCTHLTYGVIMWSYECYVETILVVFAFIVDMQYRCYFRVYIHGFLGYSI